MCARGDAGDGRWGGRAWPAARRRGVGSLCEVVDQVDRLVAVDARLRLRLHDDSAAADVEGDAGEPGRVLGEQEHRGGGDVVGLA